MRGRYPGGENVERGNCVEGNKSMRELLEEKKLRGDNVLYL